VRCFGLAMPALAAWVLAATAMGWSLALGAQSLGLATLFATALTLLGVFVFCSTENGRSPGPSWTALLWSAATGHPKGAVLGLAALVGLLFSGLVTNVVIARARPLAQHMAEVRQRLPKGAQLVSIGPADPTFAFFYGEPMRQLPWKPAELEKETDWTYFCVDLRDSRVKCDFPYEEVALACCEPHDSPHPVGIVMIGRRLWPQRDLSEISTARRLDTPAPLRR
jgi:hypothetical protein